MNARAKHIEIDFAIRQTIEARSRENHARFKVVRQPQVESTGD